jgi:hypothetical protein
MKYIVPPLSPSCIKLNLIIKTYNNDIIIYGKSLFLKQFSHVTKKIEFEIFENLNIFEYSAIQKRAHLNL